MHMLDVSHSGAQVRMIHNLTLPPKFHGALLCLPTAWHVYGTSRVRLFEICMKVPAGRLACPFLFPLVISSMIFASCLELAK